MKKYLFLLPLLLFLYACSTTSKTDDRKIIAENFFRGVYGCNPSVVDELAANDIIISYPIFQKLFGKPAISGRDSVRSFANRFCSRWKDAEFTFHNKIAEGNTVVIVWSFSAKYVGPENGTNPVNEVQGWGGITLVRFNDEDKIIAEIGEESDPGPFERTRGLFE